MAWSLERLLSFVHRGVFHFHAMCSSECRRWDCGRPWLVTVLPAPSRVDPKTVIAPVVKESEGKDCSRVKPQGYCADETGRSMIDHQFAKLDLCGVFSCPFWLALRWGCSLMPFCSRQGIFSEVPQRLSLPSLVDPKEKEKKETTEEAP